MIDRLKSDPLAALVALLRPQVVLSKTVTGGGDWAVRYDDFGHPSFGLVLEGECWITFEGGESRRLACGDFILLTSTPAFVFSSGPQPTREPVFIPVDGEVVTARRHGDQGETPDVRVLGGYFQFDPVNAPLLRDLLPKLIHIIASDGSARRIAWIVEAVSEETSNKRAGSDPILTRLIEIMLIEALRWQPDSASTVEVKSLLAGLADPQLSAALQLMHGDVAHKWTIAELARQVGMSRASFAARFSDTLGLPPMDYLMRWRMALAKDLLWHDKLSLTDVAETVGYQSACAFSAAFSRSVGEAPSAFARRRLIADQHAAPLER